jgi:hypothetical protein
MEAHPGLGSWLQAAATVAALWFAFIQITTAKRYDRRRRLHTIRALEAAIEAVIERLSFCERELMRAAESRDAKVVQSTATLVLPDSGLVAAAGALAAVPLHELDDWRLVYGLLETRAYVDKARAHLEDLGAVGSSTNPMAFSVAIRGVERGLGFLSAARLEREGVWSRRLRRLISR